MKYKNIKSAVFLSRPNRFIAKIMIDGKEEICHVKNTGRCRELLINGTQIYVQEAASPARKTKYDLISVIKNGFLVNIDSQIPNKVFEEWIKKSGYFPGISLIKPECAYGKSRFDFYLETETGRKIFVEIKGVTLEENGIAAFPDAPTERGIKHLKELCSCVENGYEAYVFFVIQMQDARLFVPNVSTHKEFAEALIEAEKAGVVVKAVKCRILSDFIEICDFVDVDINGGDRFGRYTR